MNCSSAVEVALRKLGERNDGAVKEYCVNLVMHSGRVVVEDGKGVDGNVIVDTVEAAGYDCKVNRSSAVEKGSGGGKDEVSPNNENNKNSYHATQPSPKPTLITQPQHDFRRTTTALAGSRCSAVTLTIPSPSPRRSR